MRKPIEVLHLAVGLTLCMGRVGLPAESGIRIDPDAGTRFHYADDFETARFLDDAFLSNLKVDCWQKGAIANSGPHGNRTLVYRFYGDRVITGMDLRIDQSANGPNLGGSNSLFVSSNGLDWTSIASTARQKPDRNGWQREPLTIAKEKAAAFLGRSEVWVRLMLHNSSGLKTGISNRIQSIDVKLEVGNVVGAAADPQAELRAAWTALARKAGWGPITLDWADLADGRAPHYYEDADGTLRHAGAHGHLHLNQSEGFGIRRGHLHEGRSPLSLTTYVKAGEGPVMARIVVRCRRNSSRNMNVLWDGDVISTFDVGSYFEKDRAFFVQIERVGAEPVHELKVAGSDSGEILARQIALVGAQPVHWAAKPALPAGGSLEVVSACYLPDAKPPADSQVVDGRTAQKPEIGRDLRGLRRMYREHAEFGGLRLVLRNNGPVPAHVGDAIELNGRPIDESYVDFVSNDWDARGTVWYRVRPRCVEPGKCAEVYVRFRRRPEGGHATVKIPVENGKAVETRIPYADSGVSIDYVTTDALRNTLYVYARRSAGAPPLRISEMTLDANPVKSAEVYGPELPGGVALCVAELPAPLTEGAYHVAGVTTDKGKAIAAQFRVLPFRFPRSSIHVPPSLCESMHMNLSMWTECSLETCREYDIDTTSSDPLDRHERVRFILGPDEPDAHDNRGGGYNRGLGWNARRLAESGWQELVVRYSPRAATWIIMNGTTRPLNWWVYGQFADISCFDPYPVTFYGADHAYVRESLLTARASGAPRRMYACLEAYGWGKGQGVPKGARGPTPAEYRQNVVQAIGAGMKGLTSWVHSTGAGGWALNKPVTDEITAMNALIEGIEKELLLGTPVDLARNDAGQAMTGRVDQERWPKERLWTGALLCGPDAIVVAAANHIPASKPDLPAVDPARDVAITVRLPSFLLNVQAFEATADGIVSFPCTVADGKAILQVDAIEAGRVFVLRRRPD